MNRKELVEAEKATGQKDAAEYKNLTEKIKSMLEMVVHSAGLDGIAKVRCVTDSCAEIEVERPGKSWGHDFSIYFHDRYDGTNYCRKVKMNVGTFGSFSASDKPEVNFYIVAGKFASCLEEIQHCIDDIDFKTYKDAHCAFYEANRELREFDDGIARAEEEQRKKDIEAKLIPGAKIKIDVDWHGKDKIDEILKVTPKRVYFCHYANCINKDEVIRNFICERKPWSFVA